MSEYVSIDNYPFNSIPPTNYMEFKYPLDNFQLHGCKAIDNNENVLATAHTGSGKTTLALYAIAKCYALGQKVVYTSPIKTLSNQKYKEFSNLFPNVGIITGDVKINPSAQCTIMTAEILRNSLLRKNQDDVYDWNFNPHEVSFVILDEVHFINNPERGKVWEEIIINLPSHIRLVMLSATISGAEEMAQWIGELKKIKCHLVSTNKRPVPLKHAIYWDDKLHTFLENDTQWHHGVWNNVKKEIDKFLVKNRLTSHIFHKCLDYLKNNNLMPVTVFLLNREAVENQAKSLPNYIEDHMELAEIKKIWDKHLLKYREIYQHTEQWSMIYDLVCKGVGVHHSGLIPILKEIVEILYDKGLIKVLLATETFAMGVNMPTKTVIFTNLTKFDGNEKRTLRPEEYGQMAGRAGRRGIDTQGLVIVMPFNDFITEAEAKCNILAPPQRINSKLSIDYSLVLKLLSNKIDNGNTDPPIDYITNIMTNTLFNGQQSKYIKPLNESKIEYENKLINVEKCVDSKTRDKKHLYERIIEINKILTPQGFLRPDKKLEKKLLMEKKKLEDEIGSHIKILETWINIENKLNEIKNELEFGLQKLEIHIDTILNFLHENNMIDDKDLLTKKGRIVAEMNECNPLIIAQMIEDNIFDNLSFEEIVAIMTLFVADKDRTEIYPNDLNISNKEKDCIKMLFKYSEKLKDDEVQLIQKTPLPFQSEWDLSLNMYEIIKGWVSGKSWFEIRDLYNNFEGNFIKNVLRLCNVLKNIEAIAKLLNDTKLLDKLNGYQEKLVRDIVITDSLYI